MLSVEMSTCELTTMNFNPEPFLCQRMISRVLGQLEAKSDMAANVDALMAANTESRAKATFVNMMLTDSNKSDMEYVDLPRESTAIRWEQRGIVFVSNMLDENKQDTIMERIIHHNDDFLPGATPIQLWITVTKEEFNNTTKLGNPEGSTQHLQIFHGSQRMPRFDKLIFSTTPEDAFATFLYHLTEGHMLTQHLSEAGMITISLPLRKLRVLCCHNRKRRFLRGFLVEQFQIEDEQVLGLNKQDLDNQRTWTMRTSTKNWGTIMDYYSRENNYAWSYNQIRNLEMIVSNVDVDQKKAHAYFIQQ